MECMNVVSISRFNLVIPDFLLLSFVYYTAAFSGTFWYHFCSLFHLIIASLGAYPFLVLNSNRAHHHLDIYVYFRSKNNVEIILPRQLSSSALCGSKRYKCEYARYSPANALKSQINFIWKFGGNFLIKFQTKRHFKNNKSAEGSRHTHTDTLSLYL